MRFVGVAFAYVLYVSLSCSALWANDVDADGVGFFESKIRPVLVSKCYSCHAADAKKIAGGLLLDTRSGIRAGGESGPAVVPSQPGESLLLDAIRYESFEMPPKEKLADTIVADFETWIRMGAPDPRDGVSMKTETSIDIEAGRQFWSFQSPKRSVAPVVQNTEWPESEVDQFILSKLEAAGTAPVVDADRRTLIRRVYFALIGLPPSTIDINAFVDDERPTQQALATVVDRLLESPRFGERWGRHWLDVVRFAESSGGGRSLMFANAWRFRDYVIDSMNNDKPVDQLIKEHIAGDLLAFESDVQRADQIVATGFLALGAINYEQQDKEQLRMDVIDEQISAVGGAFLGMTLGCARCHDHKFDPVPTEDYYALAGIFGSTQTLTPGNVSGNVMTPLPVSEEQRHAFQEIKKQVEALSAEINAAKKERGQLEKTVPSKLKKKNKLDRLIADLRAKKKERQNEGARIRPLAMSVMDVKEPADGHVHVRGVAHNRGAEVPRGVLSVVQNAAAVTNSISDEQSGRVELANWIANTDNPLTARVYVNRIWRHLFGVGLVPTPDNFGNTGQPPSHPRLLDNLALQFMNDGWSTKQLIRRLILSHVYRLSTSGDKHAVEIDPSNRLLWRANRRRLDAEVIRDTVLTISGQLDLTSGGRTLRRITTYDYNYKFDTVRRSVYVPVLRSSMFGFFDVFDFANPNMVVGDRNTSTLPTQSLYLLNSEFMLEQSGHTATRLLADESVGTIVDRVNLAYQEILGRSSTAAERNAAVDFLDRFPADDPNRDDTLEAWSALCHSLMSCLEFLYVD